MFQNQITSATEMLLSLREKDDYRISMFKDVMFSDDIGGLCENRVFKGIGKDNSDVTLPKAKPNDIMTYMMVADQSAIRMSIENNIRNIQNLKSAGKMESGSDVWVLLFENPNEKDEDQNIRTSVYCNPTSEDCGSLIKGDREVLACFFVSIYAFKQADGNFRYSADWTMLSPGDPSCISEYNKTIVEAECNVLKNMFWLDFSKEFQKHSEEIMNKVNVIAAIDM